MSENTIELRGIISKAVTTFDSERPKDILVQVAICDTPHNRVALACIEGNAVNLVAVQTDMAVIDGTLADLRGAG